MRGGHEALEQGVALGATDVDGLTLRLLSTDDADAFAAHIAADLPHLAEFLPWPELTSTPEGARAWIDAYAQCRDGRVLAAGAWSQGRLAGGAVLFQHVPAQATIELGCWVTSGHEGRGVGAACCRTLIALARVALRVERVEWRATPANVRSRRLAEHLGFEHEGTLRSNYRLRDGRIDTDVLSLVGGELDAIAQA